VVQQRRCADPEVSSTSKTSKRKIDTSSMLPIRTPDHSPRNFRHLTPCSKNGCNWEGPEQSNASKHFSHPPPQSRSKRKSRSTTRQARYSLEPKLFHFGYSNCIMCFGRFVRDTLRRKSVLFARLFYHSVFDFTFFEYIGTYGIICILYANVLERGCIIYCDCDCT
jgi:hypothetical protein